MSDAQVQLLVFVALVLAAALAGAGLFALAVRRTAASRGARGWEWTGERPWWGNPLVWLGVSVVLIVLGVFVAPHFLPGIVVLVPFLWIGGPRRRRDPRRNGSGG